MSVLEAAAEHIAVTMIQEAFAHLPAHSRAGALAMAKTEPIRRMLQATVIEAYTEGQKAGVRQGRLELEREMEDDWRPIAERVRAQAGSPTHHELARRRAGTATGSDYPGGPVEVW